MDKKIGGLILGLFLLGCLIESPADNANAQSLSAAQKIPPGLSGCLSVLSRETIADVPKIKERVGEEFKPEFSLKYYQKIVDFRNGTSPAWLIGYGVGQEGRVDFSRFSLVSDRGQTFFSTRDLLPLGFQEEEGYDDAAVVAISPNQYALALSMTIDTWDDGTVYIISLEKAPRVLLKFQSPGGCTNACGTRFYFTDLNHDGVQEIIAHSRFWVPRGGKIVGDSWLVLSLNPKTKLYEITKAFPEASAKAAVHSRKHPDIEQYPQPIAMDSPDADDW